MPSRRCIFILVSLLIVTIVTESSFIWSQSHIAVLHNRISRAMLLGDGSVIALSKDNSIKRYSPSGEETTVLPEINGGFQAREWLDFVVDQHGTIHSLVIGGKPEAVFSIVRFDLSQTGVLVSLDRPVRAWRIDVDSEGNYYLLGYSKDVYDRLAQKQYQDGSLYLVHKYSPKGQYIRSYMPLSEPKTRREDDVLFSSVMQTANFVVLPEGEIYFLQTLLDPQTPPMSHPRILHYVDRTGDAHVVDPSNPDSSFIITGVHKYGSQLLCEWSQSTLFTNKNLITLNGSQLGAFANAGMILSVSGRRALATLTHGGLTDLSVIQIR
jgi:hypothetical protein